MKYLIGLGNKDDNFQLNRHNVGFLFLNYLQKELNSSSWRFKPRINSLVSQTKENLYLLKPQTYMNLSGITVKKIIKHLIKENLEDLIIIHDDLDIPFGKWRLSFGKGPKQHNGVLSIEKELQDKNFWRLRIGIDNRTNKPTNLTGADYVLSNFYPEELNMLKTTVFPDILSKILEPPRTRY